MDGSLDAQRRCLAALHASCVAGPRTHANQLAALEREIALAAAAPTLASYLSASGNVFELTRATWLDRAANAARSGAAVGDRWRVRAAVLDHRAGLAAQDPADWTAAVTAGGAASGAMASEGETARSAYVRLMLTLIELHGPSLGLLGEDLEAEAGQAHRELLETDPSFTPSAPEYAARTPWSGQALDVVAEWIAGFGSPTVEAPPVPDEPLAAMEAAERAWRASLETAGPAAAVPLAVMAAGDVAAPYRTLAGALTGDDPAIAATRRAALAAADAADAESSGPAAMARLAEERLLVELSAAPLRARAQAAIERQAVWPDPVVAFHWRTLLADLEDLPSPTAFELVVAHADACFSAESAWNRLLLASLFAPLRAAFAGPSAVRRAVATTERLLGVGPRAALALPRTAAFVADVLVPLASRDPGALGSFEGEGGADLVRDARAWLAERPQGLAIDEALQALLERAKAAEPPGPAPPLTRWGRPLALADVGDPVALALRPAIA